MNLEKIKIGDILHTKYGKFKALENYAGPRFVDIKTDGGYVLLKSIVSIETESQSER